MGLVKNDTPDRRINSIDQSCEKHDGASNCHRDAVDFRVEIEEVVEDDAWSVQLILENPLVNLSLDHGGAGSRNSHGQDMAVVFLVQIDPCAVP